MGNTGGSNPSRNRGASRARPNSLLGQPSHRYTVQHIDCVRAADQEIAYEFLVNPAELQHLLPNGPEVTAPAYTVQRTYSEFQALDAIMVQKYKSLEVDLPPWTLFHWTDEEFITQRALGLDLYLNSLLKLEPLPRSRALRCFLGISQPLPLAETAWDLGATAPERGTAGLGPLTSGRWRLPVGVVAAALGFCEPLWILRNCSPVCKAMRAASRDTRCWPSLRFCCPRAERWLDSICSLLIQTCRGLRALALDLRFENPELATSMPSGIELPVLQRLTLNLRDVEAVRLGTDLLACVNSPQLRKIHVEGGMLTVPFLNAIRMIALEANGGLLALWLLWLPDKPGAVFLDEDVVIAIAELIEVVPAVQELKLGIPQQACGQGLPRHLAPLEPPHVPVPGSQPLFADMVSLSALRYLTLDFLSDDMLMSFGGLADRSMQLLRAQLSGAKRNLDNPEETLVTLLAKLGDGLEEFSLIVEVEAELQPFLQGMLRTRIGALPNQWRDRTALRSLELNWVAFDDAGIDCLVEHCPRLHTLLLDRSEYWTDDTVVRIVEGLPELQHFRLRASAMLSDQALHSLADAAHQFVSLQIQPSYCMSTYALDHLQQRLAENSQDSYLSPPTGTDFGGAINAIAAASDFFDPVGARVAFAQQRQMPNLRGRNRRCSSAKSLQLIAEEEDVDAHQKLMNIWLAKHRRPLDIGW